MKHACYVIMPYGGESAEERAKYRGIFESIIKPAAQKAGYLQDDAIIRQDYSGEDGAIIRNIIENIANCEVVIADISGMKANVYYELGLAHVFHKRSTVLISEEGTEFAFDIQGLRIIKYTKDITTLFDCIDQIAQAIAQKKAGASRIDNPVYEYMKNLPNHLTEFLGQLDENILKKRVQELETENARLRLHVKNDAEDDDDIEENLASKIRISLKNARETYRYTGTKAIQTLKNFADKEDIDKFIEFLENMLEDGEVSRSEMDSILEICDKIDNKIVMTSVLEIANSLYPDDAELMTKLAKAYASSAKTRNKALSVVNAALGLHYVDGKIESVDQRKLQHNNLARLFDTYLHMEAYKELQEITAFLYDRVNEQERPMVVRNRFIAYLRDNDIAGAEKMLEQMEELSASSDVACYSIGNYYRRKGNFEQAYRYYERAFILDDADMDYPIVLAGHILNENIIRIDADAVGTVVRGRAQKAAAAFLLYAVEKEPTQSRIMEVLNFIDRNRMSEFQAPLLAFIQDDTAMSYENTERFPLDYCLKCALEL